MAEDFDENELNNGEEIIQTEEETEEIFNEEAVEDEEEESLPFAKAEVVRLMKENLDDDKMIKERVKVEMNKFLGDILKNVCAQLNEYPYTTIQYEMLKECIYPYTNIKRINQEKQRILLHLDAIKADCDALSMDVKRTFKLKDTPEEEENLSVFGDDEEFDEEEY